MGNRANYILKKDNDFNIYYTHWRAINVAQDLTLGQKRFTQLVKEFDKSDELLNEPWIEACVLLDFDKNKLTFWETEMLFETSVREEYLRQLRNIWANWEVLFVENEMYDIEQQMQIEYTSKQKTDLEFGLIENLTDFTEDEEYFSCLIILIKNGKHFVRYINGGQEESISLIGDSIIDKLMSMKDRNLKKENSDDFFSFFIIDMDNKILWINQSITGLKSELIKRWENWTVNVGNFGYIKLLREVGIDTSELELKSDETENIVSKEILNRKDDFNPNDLAKKLVNEMGKDVKFNEHFFQNIKPKKTLWNKIKGIFN